LGLIREREFIEQKSKYQVIEYLVSTLCPQWCSVLATGPQGRGFKPGRGDIFSRAIKIRSTPFFAWEVKPEVPCSKILQNFKDSLTYQRYTNMRNSHSFVSSSYSLPDVSVGYTARELWWASQEFSSSGIISTTMALQAHIHPGNEQ
jgi:hypothetical protein